MRKKNQGRFQSPAKIDVTTQPTENEVHHFVTFNYTKFEIKLSILGNLKKHKREDELVGVMSFFEQAEERALE